MVKFSIGLLHFRLGGNEIHIFGHDWVIGQRYLSLFEVWFIMDHVWVTGKVSLIDLLLFSQVGGCLGMPNTMVKLNMSLLPVLLAKQEVPAFSYL